MLIVNKKYESLESILESNATNESDEIDEAYDTGAGFDESQAMDCIRQLKGYSSSKEELFSALVDFLYEIWDVDLKRAPSKIPFKFDLEAKKAKIDPDYRAYILSAKDGEEYSEEEDGLFKDTDIGRTRMKFGGIPFEFGTGSLFYSKSKAGLNYEHTVAGELKSMIVAASENNHPSAEILKSYIDESAWRLLPLYEEGCLDYAIDMYTDNNSIDLSQFILETGSGNTQRNANGEIYNKQTLKVTSSNMGPVLTDSGRIIADVTIKTSSLDVYISVKKEKAQLSATRASTVFNNDSIHDALLNDRPYSSCKDNADMIAYKNFCDIIGADEESLYEVYRDFVNGRRPQRIVENSESFNGKLAGIVFQKLIGGNYWYVKPNEDASYIGADNLNLVFNRQSIEVTDSGKKIKAIGTILGCAVALELRTDGDIRQSIELNDGGNFSLPYRIFPVCNVNNLRNAIANKSGKK